MEKSNLINERKWERRSFPTWRMKGKPAPRSIFRLLLLKEPTCRQIVDQGCLVTPGLRSKSGRNVLMKLTSMEMMQFSCSALSASFLPRSVCQYFCCQKIFLLLVTYMIFHVSVSSEFISPVSLCWSVFSTVALIAFKVTGRESNIWKASFVLFKETQSCHFEYSSDFLFDYFWGIFLPLISLRTGTETGNRKGRRIQPAHQSAAMWHVSPQTGWQLLTFYVYNLITVIRLCCFNVNL